MCEDYEEEDFMDDDEDDGKINLRLHEDSVNKVIEMLTKEHTDNAELKDLRKQNARLQKELDEVTEINEYGQNEWTKEKIEVERLLRNALCKFSSRKDVDAQPFFNLVYRVVTKLNELEVHSRINSRTQSIVLALTAIDPEVIFLVKTKEGLPNYRGKLLGVMKGGVLRVKAGTVTMKVDLKDVTEIIVDNEEEKVNEKDCKEK